MSEFKNRDIWVFIETDEGKVKSVGLELLNPGRMLADKAGEELVAVILGRDNEPRSANTERTGSSAWKGLSMGNTVLTHIHTPWPSWSKPMGRPPS